MIDRYHILQASTYLKELVSFPHEWGGGGTFTCNLSLRCCFEQPARSYVACLRNSNTWSRQDKPPQLLNHSGSRMTTFLFLPFRICFEKKNQTSIFWHYSGVRKLKKSRPKNSWNQINQFHEKKFSTKIHFFAISKMAKNQFLNWENCIFSMYIN